MLPSVQVGTSRLLDQEVLAGFLERVQDAEDTSGLFEQLRAEKSAVFRRKPRSLVRRDLDPVSFASLPDSIMLSRGRLQVNFRSVEQLAESMLMLARVLESEGDQFAIEFEVREESNNTDEARDVREMLGELDRSQLR